MLACYFNVVKLNKGAENKLGIVGRFIINSHRNGDHL